VSYFLCHESIGEENLARAREEIFLCSAIKQTPRKRCFCLFKEAVPSFKNGRGSFEYAVSQYLIISCVFGTLPSVPYQR